MHLIYRNREPIDPEKMTTEQLEALLQADMAEEICLPPETALEILDILEKRQAAPTASKAQVEAAYQDFLSRYATPEGEGLSLYPVKEAEAPAPGRKKKPLGFLRYAVAAVLALALLVPLLSRGIRQPAAVPTDPTREPVSAYEGLQQLHGSLVELGITQQVVPTWMPEGYTLRQLCTIWTPEGQTVIAAFGDGKEKIQMTFTQLGPDAGPQVPFQLNADERDWLEADGVTYYLKRCMQDWAAGWTVDRFQCTVTTDADKVVLTQMLNSIC